MKARTTRRLRSAASITAVFLVVSISWDFVATGRVTPPAFVLGVLIGLPLIILEQTSFAEKTRALPFTAALLVKTVTYVGVLSLVFLGVGFVSGAIKGLRIADFVALLWPFQGITQLLEYGPAQSFFETPQHELTAAYISGVRG